MIQDEFVDEMLLKYRKKYRQISNASLSLDEPRYIKDRRIAFERVQIFENISIYLPGNLFDLTPEEMKDIFRYKDVPKVVKSDQTNAIFTFDAFPSVPENIAKESEDLQNAMKKLYPGHVFYESGDVLADKLSVYWFEYKSPALSKEKYNMLFLFGTPETSMLGKFICPFEDYDEWKPTVLDLLRTITVKGSAETCEKSE